MILFSTSEPSLMQLFELWMLPKKVCRPGVNVEEHLLYIIP